MNRNVEWSAENKITIEHVEHGLEWISKSDIKPARTPWGPRYLVCLSEDQVEILSGENPEFPIPLGPKTDPDAYMSDRFSVLGMWKNGIVCLVDFGY